MVGSPIWLKDVERTATSSLPFCTAQVVDVDDYRKAFDKFDTDGSGHWTECAQVWHLGIRHNPAM